MTKGNAMATRERRAEGPDRDSTSLLLGLLVLGLVALPALVASPALAQEVSDPARQAADEDPAIERQVADEITVTARKREENIQEVPVAVTVTSGEVLEDTSSPDISVLQSYVPNLSVYAGRNQSTTLTAFLRGIGQADPLWGVDPGVGLYLDDVYMARPQGALLDVYDVERVEVLRGPRARSTARTPSAAPSSTSAGRRPTSSKRGLGRRRQLRHAGPARRGQRPAGRGQAARQARRRLAAARRLGREPLHRPRRVEQGQHRLPPRLGLAGERERHRAVQRRPHRGRRRAQGLPAPGDQPPVPDLPRHHLPAVSTTATTPRAAWRRSTAPTPRATR
jgi:hypothetical protein